MDKQLEQPVTALLRNHPFAKDLNPDSIESLAECARKCRIARGEFVWRQGEKSNLFYLICSGQVALEISLPHQGPLQIETIDAGDVLGWPWLLPLRRLHFDARTITEVTALGVDSLSLGERCERDQSLGYAVFRRIAALTAERLEATRLRLLDLYGPGGISAVKRASD